MRFTRSFGVSVVCVMALAAGCGGSAQSGVITAPRLGVIAGLVSPCVGVALSSNYVKLPVRVTLSQRSHTLASEVVHGRATYRFMEPQGQYLVSTDAPGTMPVHVILRPGEVARANVLARCR